MNCKYCAGIVTGENTFMIKRGLCILSVIVLCAISYQIGFNQKNLIVYGEIEARSVAEKELMDMQIQILQKEVKEVTANYNQIFEFATGAGMGCCS